MNKAPNLYRLQDLPRRYPLGSKAPEFPSVKIDGQWMPARPLGFYSIINRTRLAWMVFTGKADALQWPGGQ